MVYPFYSTKTYTQAFPIAYRQWRADSSCRLLHGYALSIHLEFGGFDLDARNWLVDFGSLKPLKAQLEDWFDHTLLVAQDDPQHAYLVAMHKMGLAKVTEVERTGCEGLSDFIFEHLNGDQGWLKDAGYWGRVVCTKVEVRETDSNMAMRTFTHEDHKRLCTALRVPVLPDGYSFEDDVLLHRGNYVDRLRPSDPCAPFGYTFEKAGGARFILKQEAADAMFKAGLPA